MQYNLNDEIDKVRSLIKNLIDTPPTYDDILHVWYNMDDDEFECKLLFHAKNTLNISADQDRFYIYYEEEDLIASFDFKYAFEIASFIGAYFRNSMSEPDVIVRLGYSKNLADYYLTFIYKEIDKLVLQRSREIGEY